METPSTQNACIFHVKCLALKDNSTMYKTEAQIISYGILYLTQVPTSANLHTRSILLFLTPPNRHKIEALRAAILAS